MTPTIWFGVTINKGNMMRKIVLSLVAGVVLIACDSSGNIDNALMSTSNAALTSDTVCYDGDPACGPTGAHEKHSKFACSVCHKYGGRLTFDASGPAYGANLPRPSFDATSKTCSNVACHAVPSGSFSYWAPACDDVPEVCTQTVYYGGASGNASPSWYSTSSAGSCNACHNFPARLADGRVPTWHSGMHGINIPNGNACQLCHPDVSGAYVYGGLPIFTGTSAGLIASCPLGTYCASTLTITDPSKHGNGVVDVTPGFKSACFGCH